ncbi:MAG: hypothetical protein KBS81_03680 [Spirochaetales bacterium]|nr:hypothetical protein [Candidatus Physcosoma equi]
MGKTPRKANTEYWFLEKPTVMPTKEEITLLKQIMKGFIEHTRPSRSPELNTIMPSVPYRLLQRIEKSFIPLYPYFKEKLLSLGPVPTEKDVFYSICFALTFPGDPTADYEKSEEGTLWQTALFLLEELDGHEVLLEDLETCPEDNTFPYPTRHLLFETRTINKMVWVLRQHMRNNKAKAVYEKVLSELGREELGRILRNYHENWMNILTTVVSKATGNQEAKGELFDGSQMIPLQKLQEKIDLSSLLPPGVEAGNVKAAFMHIQMTRGQQGYFLLMDEIIEGKELPNDTIGLYQSYLERRIPMTEREFYAAEYFLEQEGLPYVDTPFLRTCLVQEINPKRENALRWRDVPPPHRTDYLVEGLDDPKYTLNFDRLHFLYAYAESLGKKQEPTEEDFRNWVKMNGDGRGEAKVTRRQVFNDLGNMTLPSQVKINRFYYNLLRYYGYDKETAENLAIFREMANRPDPAPLPSSVNQPIAEVMPIEEKVTIKTEDEEKTALRKELKKREKEVAELRHLLENARKTEETLQAEAQETKAELDSLKNSLFTYAEDEANEEEKYSNPFPASLSEHVVLFGGRCNFKKHLKRYLPTLRCYDSLNVDFDAIIRESDHIFLQTNAMSHSLYHVVMNTLKKNRKPFTVLNTSSSHVTAEIILQKVMEKRS